MQYDFDTLTDRRSAGSEKWNMMYSAKPGVAGGVVPLSVADMEFPVAPEIRTALNDYITHQIPGYSTAPEGFSESVCAFLRRRHGLSVTPEMLVQTPGVVYALPRAIRAVTQPGEGVIIMTPVYYPFYRVIEDARRRIVSCPLNYTDGRYTMDLDLFDRLAAEQDNTALLFCSPHNPVGRVWTEEELRCVADICSRRGLHVISDEIHFDLLFPGQKHTSFLQLSGPAAETAIVCTAPSKTFNLAGMNLSNLVIRDGEIRKKIRELLRADATPMQNPFGYVACQAAYDHGEGWLDALLAYLDENRRYVCGFLAAHIPQLYAVPLEGTYLQWIDCTRLGLAPDALERLMTAHDLFFDEGYLFGKKGAGFERLNLACPRAVLVQAMDRLQAAAAHRT